MNYPGGGRGRGRGGTGRGRHSGRRRNNSPSPRAPRSGTPAPGNTLPQPVEEIAPGRRRLRRADDPPATPTVSTPVPDASRDRRRPQRPHTSQENDPDTAPPVTAVSTSPASPSASPAQSRASTDPPGAVDGSQASRASIDPPGVVGGSLTSRRSHRDRRSQEQGGSSAVSASSLPTHRERQQRHGSSVSSRPHQRDRQQRQESSVASRTPSVDDAYASIEAIVLPGGISATSHPLASHVTALRDAYASLEAIIPPIITTPSPIDVVAGSTRPPVADSPPRPRHEPPGVDSGPGSSVRSLHRAGLGSTSEPVVPQGVDGFPVPPEVPLVPPPASTFNGRRRPWQNFAGPRETSAVDSPRQ